MDIFHIIYPVSTDLNTIPYKTLIEHYSTDREITGWGRREYFRLLQWYGKSAKFGDSLNPNFY